MSQGKGDSTFHLWHLPYFNFCSYGMTENCAICTRCLAGDPTSSGTVGPPQPAAEMKLVDVPAMNYTAEDKPYPRGEICCRGPAAFTQYYKGPCGQLRLFGRR